MKKILTLVAIASFCQFFSGLAYGVSKIPEFLEASPEGQENIEKLLRSEQYKQAIDIIEKKLETSPNDPELLLISAYAEAGLKQWDKAIQRIKEAVYHAPTDKKDEYMIDMANIHHLQKSYGKSEEIYQDILKKNPKNIRAMYNLGYLFQKTGKKSEAMNYYSKILQLAPNHTKSFISLIQLNMQEMQYDKAISLSRQFQKNAPEQTEGYYYEAIALIRQNKPNYAAAIALLKKASDNNPKDVQLLYMLSYTYVKNEQYKESQPILEEIVRISHDFPEAYRLLAIMALKQNNPSAAIQYLEKESALKPSSELYHLIGKLYLEIGNKDAGINALNKSLESSSLQDIDISAEKGLYEYLYGNLEASANTLKKAIAKSSDDKFETHILLIVNLLNQHKYQEVNNEVESALKKFSGKQELLLNLLSQAYIGEGKLEEAEKTLTKALTLKPDFYLTHINLSAIYFQQRKYDKTKEELKKIISRDPKNIQANILLAKACQAASENQAAEKILKSLLEINPSALLSLKEMLLLNIKMKQFEEALQYADKFISIDSESVEGYILKSRIYASMGNITESLDTIDSGLEKIGENPGVLATAAHLSTNNGLYDRALTYLERCKSKYGLQHSELKYLYVGNLIETGKAKEARNFIEKEFKKDDIQTSYLLGISWIKSGDLAKAEEYLEKVVLKNNRLNEAIFNLAKVKLTRGKKDKAKELFKKAIELNPKEEKYYIALAMLYEIEKETDNAIALYQEGLSKHPDSIPLLNNIAILYLQKNDTQKAVSYADQVLKIAPDDPNILDTFGQIYYKMNNFERAVSYLEKAAERIPDSMLFHYHLGLCYYKMDKIKEAKRSLEISISKDKKVPWQSEVKQILGKLNN